MFANLYGVSKVAIGTLARGYFHHLSISDLAFSAGIGTLLYEVQGNVLSPVLNGQEYGWDVCDAFLLKVCQLISKVVNH